MFIEENENGLIYMRSDIIGAKHAFTTRFGGVSGGEACLYHAFRRREHGGVCVPQPRLQSGR